MTAEIIHENRQPQSEALDPLKLIERRIQESENRVLGILTAPGVYSPDELSLDEAASLLQTDTYLLARAAQDEGIFPDQEDEARDTFSADELVALSSCEYLGAVWFGEIGRLLEVPIGEVLAAAKEHGLTPAVSRNVTGEKGHELHGYYDLDQLKVIQAAIEAKRPPKSQPQAQPQPPQAKLPVEAAVEPKELPPAQPPNPKLILVSKTKPAASEPELDSATLQPLKPALPPVPELLPEPKPPEGYLDMDKVLDIANRGGIGYELFHKRMEALEIKTKTLESVNTGREKHYIASVDVARVFASVREYWSRDRSDEE